MNRSSLCLLLMLLLGGSPALLAGGGRPDSEYTSTAEANALSKDRHPESPDVSSVHFPGLGGYEVLLVQDGEVHCSYVNLRWHGQTVDLYDQTKECAPEEFYKKNDKIEWRGLRGSDGKLVPYALIYRVGGKKNGKEVPTRLLIIRLAGEKSEILGFAEGADEDADAKKIADHARPE